MTTQKSKAIAQQLYDDFNRCFGTGDFTLLDEVIASGVIDHSPAPGQAPGSEGLKRVLQGFLIAFPDFHFTVEDMVAEGDKVASRLTVTGTQRGPLPQGIPATGKPVAVGLVDMVRVANGKVVERWGVIDNLGLLQQLGVIPVPGA